MLYLANCKIIDKLLHDNPRYEIIHIVEAESDDEVEYKIKLHYSDMIKEHPDTFWVHVLYYTKLIK